jgi:hypothetical protein
MTLTRSAKRNRVQNSKSSMSRVPHIILLSLVLVMILGVTVATGRKSPIRRVGQGIPISAEDKAAVKQLLIDKVVSEFKDLAAENKINYDELKGSKAAAICKIWPRKGDDHDSGVLYFGAEWGGATLKDASELALKECNAAKDNPRAREWARLGVTIKCDCQLLFQDSTIVLVPPEEAISLTAEKLSQLVVPTLCPDWFASKYFVVNYWGNGRDPRPCPGYTNDDVRGMGFVIDFVGPSPHETSPNIFPGAPIVRTSDIKARRITDPTTGRLVDSRLSFYPPVGDGLDNTAYSLPPGWIYRFRLHRVPPSVRAVVLDRLRSLEHSKLYGKFGQKKVSSVALPSFNPSDMYAQYVRSYDLSDVETAQALDFPEFPEHGLNVLRGERSRRLWVECSTPVDRNWIPVGAPLRSVVPIALESTKALYLFSIEVERSQNWGGGTSTAFQGRVFDLSGCTNPSDCFRDVRRTLIGALTAEFGGAPLSASRVYKGMPPFQIRFQRPFENSNVLSGFTGPYYELSTYTITLWDGPSADFFGTPEGYFEERAKAEPGRYGPATQVFLQIDQALQIAVGRSGEYAEPNAQQYAAYQKAVEAAVGRALMNTAQTLGGTFENGVGKIKRQGKR